MVPSTTIDPSRAKLRHRRHVGGFAAFGRAVVRLRWVVVALWLIVPTVLWLALPSLASQVNNDTTAFLPAGSPSLAAARLAEPIIGSTTAASVNVVATSPTPLSATQAAAIIGAIRSRVTHVLHVKKVDPGVLSSDELAVQMVAVSSVSQFNQSASNTLVADITAAAKSAELPHGVVANVAGPVATNVASQTTSQRSAGSTTIFSLLFIIALLVLIFRSPLAPLVTLIPALFALRLADPVIGALGQAGLKISFVA
ncbi:MAG TPA: MMPL family transporter, partial [Acidimicrobiales bacterium]